MDLVAIALFTVLLQPFIYGVPAEPLRIALGLMLVLFSPGYVFVSALYPRRARNDRRDAQRRRARRRARR